MGQAHTGIQVARSCYRPKDRRWQVNNRFRDNSPMNATNPFDPNAIFQQAVSFHAAGKLPEAAALYRKLIELFPQHPVALAYLGMVEFQQGNLEESVRLLRLSLQINPNQPEALSFLGSALQHLGRLDDAVAAFDRAIALKPDLVEVLVNRGLVLRDLKRLDEALASCDRAIVLRPDHAEALNNRGLVLQDLERFDEALACFDRAIALKPDLAALHDNRGNSLYHLKRVEEALASIDRAIALNPDFAEAHNHRGNALQHLKHTAEALASYDRAIALKPDYAEAYMNKGNALLAPQRFEEALASYDRAIALKPTFVEALIHRGNMLKDRKRYDEALESYDRAIAINPDHEFLYGSRLHTKMQICDWRDLENQGRQLQAKIDAGKKVTGPLTVLALSDSPALQRKAAEIYTRSQHPLSHALPEIGKTPRHAKIRIGYFSADFRNHPVSILAAELFETHDKSRFELTALSFGPETDDDLRQRVMGAFDRFIDVRHMSDKEVALLARDLEIDIAIDLGGYTQDCRPDIFAMRAAPVQVNYLGYCGTMGAEFMDYLIADPVVIPEESRQYYCEKIAYLPCYMPSDSKRRVADPVFTRKDLGLPKSGFVFCCFNNSNKISPDTFDAWMRILKRVDGSVLWLSSFNKKAASNLANEAVRRGISAERVIFADLMPLQEDHLARIRLADLFLDTLPYNAHTTASDALWVGLPLLTCRGQSFAGRVAASLLNTIGAPELITSSREEYEARAVGLATDPEMLKEIREKLAQNRQVMPLFDTPLFTRYLEAAYTAMHERSQAGLPPDHIFALP